MSHELPATEGYLSFAGYRTWYRVTGESEEPGKFPLLCLHGGPGATWHHMEPLAEVAAVRKELGLDRCHVLGHSWGGMLGMAYAITRPAGLVSLLVESSPASVPFWLTELARLRADLPPEVDEVLRRHEAAGSTDSEEYHAAMVAFYDRHVCRLRPYPDWLDRCFSGLEANPEVYYTMNGPSEFHVIGSLKDFDITADLGAIEAPTLLFCGEFDEVTPATVAQAHERIGGSQFVVLPGCSHMGQAERPDLTLGMVRGWLAGVEASPRA